MMKKVSFISEIIEELKLIEQTLFLDNELRNVGNFAETEQERKRQRLSSDQDEDQTTSNNSNDSESGGKFYSNNAIIMSSLLELFSLLRSIKLLSIVKYFHFNIHITHFLFLFLFFFLIIR